MNTVQPPANHRLLEPDEVHPENNLHKAGVPCIAKGLFEEKWDERDNEFAACSLGLIYAVPADTPRITPPLNAQTVGAWRKTNPATQKLPTRSRERLTLTATLRRRAGANPHGMPRHVI